MSRYTQWNRGSSHRPEIGTDPRPTVRALAPAVGVSGIRIARSDPGFIREDVARAFRFQVAASSTLPVALQMEPYVESRRFSDERMLELYGHEIPRAQKSLPPVRGVIGIDSRWPE